MDHTPPIAVFIRNLWRIKGEREMREEKRKILGEKTGKKERQSGDGRGGRN